MTSGRHRAHREDVSDRAHHPPGGERRRAGPRPRRGARGAAGRPVRRRGGGGAGQGRRALAGPAAVPRPGYVVRRRRLRQRRLPLARARWSTRRSPPSSAAHAEAVERWAPARSVWPLLDVIDARRRRRSRGARTLARHLGDRRRRTPAGGSRSRGGWPGCSTTTASPGRRCCAPGRPAATRRGDGDPLDDDLRWQPELWRRLRDRLDSPSPAELLDDACQQLRDQPDLSALPDRLSVFGASRLSPARLQVLAALAEHRDVHLWLHHSSPALWDTVAAAPTVGAPPRRHDPQPARQPAAHQPVPRRPRAAAAHRPLRPRRRRRSCTTPRRSAGHPARPAQGRPRRRPGPGRPATPRPTATAASRCTPATAAPGRSRCCARSSSGCSPTTRRSSRATCSSCAPTSRPSRRSSRPPSRSAPRTTRRTRRRGCGSGSPTARCGRPTRCSPCCPSCSSSAPRGSPRARCSTWRARRRCGSVSASTTTSSSGCATGRSAPASAGASTREHRATWQLGDVEQGSWRDRARPAAARRRHGGRPRRVGRHACPSTTSTAPTSTWPAGSPSWSTGWPPRST